MKIRALSRIGFLCVAVAAVDLMAAAPGGVTPPISRGPGGRVGIAPAAGTLEQWLAEHPKIRDRVAFVTGDGTREDYVKWTPAMKARIEAIYAHLKAGDRDLGLKLPDPAKAPGYYPADCAFDIFAARDTSPCCMFGRWMRNWGTTRSIS